MKNRFIQYHCSFTLSFPFIVIESHPDNALEDLRLDKPFAELKDHVKSYDLDSMDKKVCALFSCICLNLFY